MSTVLLGQQVAESQLLQAKLYIPRARPGLVPRPTLVDRLNQGARGKLTLISAPAGFGKTTLLAEWLATAEVGRDRAAWVALDQSDNEPTLFWAYFIAALQTVYAQVGTRALALLHSPQPLPVETLQGTLLNEISALPQPIVVVLDDYHLIGAQLIGKVYVAGDAAITAANVATNSGLVRVGVVADLFQATEWVFLAIALWLLLRHVNTNAASAMVILVAVGAGITCLNDVFQFEAVRVATDASFVALGAASSSALVLLLLDMHHYGFLIAQIFFGLWLVPLGYLVYTSGMFPRALGGALIVGGACYLVGLLAVFLVPDVGETINVFVTIPSAIAEISMVLYLLVKGVRSTPIDAIDRGQMLTASVSAAA